MTESGSAGIDSQQPTTVRWRIAFLLFAVVVVTFLDRVNLSVAARYIQVEYSFTNVQLGWILSAYIVGYSICQIPGGLLADRLGPRAVLTFAIAWWSLFTVLTAAAPWAARLLPIGLIPCFFLARFMVGVGEAAALPNCNKAIGAWIPPRDRGMGNSIFFTGIGIGGAISAPLIVWLTSIGGWRWALIVSGSIGMPVAALWWWYGRNRPEEHPGVNSAELRLIRSGSSPSISTKARFADAWKELSGNPSLWALVVSYTLQGYVVYIFYSWFYLYVVTVRHFSVEAAGHWAMIPFLAMAVMTPLGGRLSDQCVRRFGATWGRRLPAMAGTGVCGLLLMIGARVAHQQLGTTLIGVAAGFLNFGLGSWWATVNDMSPVNSGVISSIMNTGANVAGIASPVLTPYIGERFGWVHSLDLAALVIFASGAAWLFVRQPRGIGAS
jgi:ACS family glucarate transporter-like MFS transporter